VLAKNALVLIFQPIFIQRSKNVYSSKMFINFKYIILNLVFFSTVNR